MSHPFVEGQNDLFCFCNGIWSQNDSLSLFSDSWFANLQTVDIFPYLLIILAIQVVVFQLYLFSKILKRYRALFVVAVAVACSLTFYHQQAEPQNAASVGRSSAVAADSNNAVDPANVVADLTAKETIVAESNRSPRSETASTDANATLDPFQSVSYAPNDSAPSTGTFSEPATPLAVRPDLIDSRRPVANQSNASSQTSRSNDEPTWNAYPNSPKNSIPSSNGENGSDALTRQSKPAAIDATTADFQTDSEKILDSNARATSVVIPQPRVPNPNEIQPRATQNNETTSNELFLPTAIRLSDEMRKAIDRVRPSVVHIQARVGQSPENPQASGTRNEETGCGVISIIEQKAYVITNGHVAGNSTPNDVDILLGNQKMIHPVKILTCDDFDVALLEIKLTDIMTDLNAPDSKVRVAPLGDSDLVQTADFVLNIGSPFGLEGSVSHGIISARSRRKVAQGSNPNRVQDFLQTNTPANPGNSGGPLFNTQGEVVGMVTAILSTSGVTEGITFAIPINNIKHVARQLVQKGRYSRPYVGVEIDSSFKGKTNYFQGQTKPCGVQIKAITERSPASVVGLQRGDVILTYNNVEIEDDAHFIQLIALSEVGQTPELVVWRNGRLFVVKPVLNVKG